MNQSFIFLDVETHSLDNPIIIQLAYINSQAEERFNQFYSTGGELIDLKAMAVHHIRESDLVGKPTFVDSDSYNQIGDILGKEILVAHNSAFDAEVLRNHGVDTPQVVCTLKLARFLYPEIELHRLQYLRYYFDIELDEQINPHDALSDVLVLEKVFNRLYEDLKKYYPEKTEEELVTEMIDITKRPSLLHICRFGKYKWLLWSEVPTNYLDWIINKSDFDDPDVLYTAEYYL